MCENKRKKQNKTMKSGNTKEKIVECDVIFRETSHSQRYVISSILLA